MDHVKQEVSFERVKLGRMGQVAEAIIQEAGMGTILLFKGPMGSGKTHLIKEICNLLEVTDQVTSPTFSLVNEYRTKDGSTLYHFDLFRARNLAEVMDIGFTEYLDSGNTCLIEWPELIESLVDFPYFEIRLESTEGGMTRSITFTRYG